VWSNILDHLQQQGVRVSAADEAAGRIVVTYSGDPEPYVDCGWLVIRNEGDEFERVPAARSEASFLRRRAGEVITVERDLKLDARTGVQVEPFGEDAVLRADSTYALTKSIESSGAGAFARRDDPPWVGSVGRIQLGHAMPADRQARASGVRRHAQGLARGRLSLQTGSG
jgi:hypothetical protein